MTSGSLPLGPNFSHPGNRRRVRIRLPQLPVAKVLPATLASGDGDRETPLAWAVPTKYPGTGTRGTGVLASA
jgi:hypothetical protein